jgi:serine/threonine-protein kinase
VGDHDTTPDARLATSPAPDDVPLAAGALVAANLRIARLLGRGGQGHVYEALDTSTGARIAIKLLNRTLAADPEVVARLEREAKTASAIVHPNVTRIFGLERTRGGDIYLRMELLSGEGLDQRLQRGPLGIDEACGLARQVASGLGAAHRIGVIHRDIKPANIFLSHQTAKIMDFGIAKAGASWDLTALTHTGKLIGTPAYMSPEQIAAPDALDHRTDVYSLGLVLYEMLTGERAFGGRDVLQILVAQTKTPPVHPRKLRPEIPSPIAEVVMECLAKKPEARHASMEAFIDRLDRSRTAAAASIQVSPAADRARPTVQLTPNRPLPIRTKRAATSSFRRRAAVAAAIALGCAGAVYGIAMLFGREAIPVETIAVEPPVAPLPVEPPQPPIAPAPPPVPQPILPATGSARITSEPTGAVVLLGTTVMGQTPLAIDLAAQVEHRLELRKNDYVDASVVVRLKPGESWNRHVTLSAIPRPAPVRRPPPEAEAPPPPPAEPGFLTLTTVPWTQVTIDGRPRGVTPLFKVELSPGEHTLHLTNREAGIDVRRSVLIPSGQLVKQQLELP